MNIHTPEHPCRCGHDGTGTHQCHAWREPGPVPRCTEPGETRLIGTPACLAGMQMKTGATTATYCSQHWAEAVDPRDPVWGAVEVDGHTALVDADGLEVTP